MIYFFTCDRYCDYILSLFLVIYTELFIDEIICMSGTGFKIIRSGSVG